MPLPHKAAVIPLQFVVLAIGQPQGLGQSVCLAHLLTGLTGIFTPV